MLRNAPRALLVNSAVVRSLAKALWVARSSAPKNSMQYKGSMDVYAQVGEKAESPAAERNKQPILEVLRQYVPAEGSGCVLEVASGSGQHVAHFAAALPHLTFQPSDQSSELFGSINAYCQGLANVRVPVVLDASSEDSWASTADIVPDLTAVVCINMCHISPLEATLGLIKGAGARLKPAGLLFIYGPFTRDGAHTSESNAAFHASLQQRNPAWGYRDIGQVSELAAAAGFEQLAVLDMPANNFSLVFRRK